MDFASILFIIVAMAYVAGGVAQCVKPLGLSEFTPATAKSFRVVSICCCFVAAVGCVFVAMGTDNAVLSIIGCAILVSTLIIEILCSRKLVLKNEPHPSDEPEVPSKKQEKATKEAEEYEPYDDGEYEELDEDESEEEAKKSTKTTRHSNKQID